MECIITGFASNARLGYRSIAMVAGSPAIHRPTLPATANAVRGHSERFRSDWAVGSLQPPTRNCSQRYEYRGRCPHVYDIVSLFRGQRLGSVHVLLEPAHEVLGDAIAVLFGHELVAITA